MKHIKHSAFQDNSKNMTDQVKTYGKSFYIHLLCIVIQAVLVGAHWFGTYTKFSKKLVSYLMIRTNACYYYCY